MTISLLSGYIMEIDSFISSKWEPLFPVTPRDLRIFPVFNPSWSVERLNSKLIEGDFLIYIFHLLCVIAWQILAIDRLLRDQFFLDLFDNQNHPYIYIYINYRFYSAYWLLEYLILLWEWGVRGGGLFRVRVLPWRAGFITSLPTLIILLSAFF